MKKTSKFSGFYRKEANERLALIKEMCGLTQTEADLLSNTGDIQSELLDGMIENVIGGFILPLGIATNFLIDGKEVLIPMVTEEPSVVAAASNGAKMSLPGGGFRTRAMEPVMIGQVQIVGIEDVDNAKGILEDNSPIIIEKANKQDPMLIELGGGVKDIAVKDFSSPSGPMVVLYLYVDVRDAMGANAVNTMAEAVAPLVEELTGGSALLRILSNLAVRRLIRSEAVFRKSVIGKDIIESIVKAHHFAEVDPFRAATHNKGIMNGISALVRATGNDTRAVEAGAHAFASMSGRYMPLTKYVIDKNGDLSASIELPLAVGTVGGATRSHPQAKISMKILGVERAVELGQVMASLGLAQNFAALRALASEGIQRGHMKLHARNIAIAAGAEGDEVGKTVRLMIEKGGINHESARRFLKELED